MRLKMTACLRTSHKVFSIVNPIAVEEPVPVAARSKAWVCGRSPAEIVGSNPTEGMDICLL
jgi:hypothetical protein